MEKDVEQIVKERIEENKKIFDEKEFKIIFENIGMIEKIYLIAIADVMI